MATARQVPLQLIFWLNLGEGLNGHAAIIEAIYRIMSIEANRGNILRAARSSLAPARCLEERYQALQQTQDGWSGLCHEADTIGDAHVAAMLFPKA